MPDTPLDLHVRHALRTAAAGPVTMEVDLRLESGSITALTGPSGVGKTTLLRMIAGLVKPEAGRISFANEVWLDTEKQIFQSPQQRRTGLVFQDYALFPHLTVRQNIAFALPRNDDSTRVDVLLDEMEITQLADSRPHQLSGGQQQRVALARALVPQPQLLLLDEPLSALDRAMRQRLQNYLLTIHRKHQLTILLVTHDLGEIFRLADYVLEMEAGKIVRQGTPQQVFATTDRAADGPALYAEVLSCRIESEFAIVGAFIDQKLHQLKIPLDVARQLVPGSSFLLRYSVERPIIEVLR